MHVLLEQSKNDIKQVCFHCQCVPRYLLFLKYGHLICFSCFRKYRRHKSVFENIILCTICKQSCQQEEIHLYKVEKISSSNFISINMFKTAKFICSCAECKKSYAFEKKIHYHVMFAWAYQSILCSAKNRRFMNYMETVIINSINCFLHLLSCVLFSHCTMSQFWLIIAM